MFHHNTVTGRRVRKLDVMSGSERMLKAHHKNAVFHKSLEDRKSVFDADCQKRLSKVQHDIYNIYFNEYVPLKEEANRIQQRLPSIHDGTFQTKLKKLATISGNNGGSRLPAIHSLCLVSSAYKDADEKNKRTESFLDLLRQQELERSKNKKISGKQKYATEMEANIKTPCSFWPDSDSDDSLPIDEKRLKILKTAIGLTSQPVKSPEPRKPRRLRRSFLLTLRRQSKLVWEQDLLKRIGAPQRRSIQNTEISEDNENVTDFDGEKNENSNVQCHPQFSKNVVSSEKEESDNKQYLADLSEKRLPDADQLNQTTERLLSRSRASMDSAVSESLSVQRRSFSKYIDAPVHDLEDLYCTESSPDIFSVISEATGSFSSGSSFTTGSSGADSDSSYSSSEDT